MGDISDHQPHQETHGIIRFSVPDLSVPAYDRALFSSPASKSVTEQRLVLHDFRGDTTLLQGCDALDTYGFTYIKHQSALSESDHPTTDWFHGNNIEDVYIPEVTKLVCELTGAKSAVVNNIAFRRRLANKQEDRNFYHKRDGPLDKEITKSPRDAALVYGKEAAGSLEPSRLAHIDYTVQALRDTARYCRRDIKAAAQAALDAEDASSQQTENDSSTTKIPRYAVFSVWRPVRPVKRDPLVVCDMRTVSPDECVASPYRALSDITESGEYMMESVVVSPPRSPDQQKWYWMPEQRADEVLVVKFADTGVNNGSTTEKVLGGICGAGGGAPHCSPVIEGTEDEEPRVSIEARVLAFW